MPETWQKLLTESTVTREDYARNPQAVLDVLQFYTDHQKREMEELGPYANSHPGTSGNTLSPSTLSPYPQTSGAPRFNAGMGLGGIGNTSLDSRPPLPQPPPTISPVTTNLQANRPAPPRPLLTANRPAPPAPRQRTPLQGYTPPPADPPPAYRESLSERDRERELRQWERDMEREQREKEKRPQITTSESSPATGPPPVKPLQLPVKKTATPAVTITQPEKDRAIEAALAALRINDLPEGKDTGLPQSPPSNRADRDRKKLDPDGFPKLQNTNNPNGMSSVSWRSS